MKILHVNAGNEDGGGLTYIIGLMKILNLGGIENELLVLEEGPVAQAARKEGFKVHLLSDKGKFDLRILQKLRRFIKLHDFDVIHTHGPRANLFMNILNDKNIFWVTTVHSDPTIDFRDRGILGKIMERLNVSSIIKADGIFTVSNRASQNLSAQLNLSPSRIQVAELGINTNEDNLFHKEEHDKFTLTMVGRLEPVKNHLLVFEALKASGINNIKLNVIGDGILMPELSNWILDNGMENKIDMLGFMNQEQINHVYETTDMAILGSDNEGFALVLLEAAQHRIPLISTNVGAAQKIIRDDTMGIIVPVSDEQAYKEAILKGYDLYNSHSLDKMGQQIFNHVKNEFSYENTFKKVINGYDKFKAEKEQNYENLSR